MADLVPIQSLAGVFGGDQISLALYRCGFRLGRTVGEGSYCKVRAAEKTLRDGSVATLACKSIDKRRASQEYVGKFLPRELSIVRAVRHPCIVRVYDIFETPERVFVFMEMCGGGDLLEYIRDRGAVAEAVANRFFRQLVDAVDYLHTLDVAHRDLKCENILLCGRRRVKIADFGFARWCRDCRGRRQLSDTFCGSAAYAAPEILQGVSYNPAMYDVWSLGVVLYIMLSAAMPYDDADVGEMLRAQLNRQLVFPVKVNKTVSSPARFLVNHMLEPDVTRRITVHQIKAHDWLRVDQSQPIGSSQETAWN